MAKHTISDIKFLQKEGVFLMKKKHFASIAAALAMVATMPVSSIATMFVATPATMVAVAADTEQTGYKTGDIITLTKADWNISKPSATQAAADRIDIYATKLDGEGKMSCIATLSADDPEDSIDIKYNSYYGYMIKYSPYHAGTMKTSDTYYYLNSKGEWEIFWASGEQVSMPPIRLYFSNNNFGYMKDIIGDSPIKIYETQKDGTNKLVKTMYFEGSEKYAEGDWIFAKGLEFENYTWSVNIDYTEVFERSTRHATGTITGGFLATKPYISNKDIQVSTTASSVPNYTDEDIANGTVNEPKHGMLFDLEFPKTDDNGHVIYDKDGNPVIDYLSNIDHGDAWVIKDTNVIQELSAGDLKNSIPYLDDYDSSATYFIKVGIDESNTEFLYYRYNPRSGWWDFRVNTKDTPMYGAEMNITNYPDEMAGGIMYNKKSSSGKYDGNEYEKWTEEEFSESGKKIQILTNSTNYTYTSFFDYGTQGGIYYQYVGIDPIPVYAYGDRANGPLVDRSGVPSNAEAGDIIEIEGTDPNGKHVHFEVTQEFDNDDVPCGVGDYTIVNKSKGLQSDVEDGEAAPPYYDEVTDRDVLNLSEAVEQHTFVIRDMKGELVTDGDLKNPSKFTLDNLIEDIGMPEKQIEWFKTEPYYAFESVSGVINSSNPDDYLIDTGYFIFDNSKDAKTGDIVRVYTTGVEGDVNQDGEFSIADLVFEQKYLLNALEEPFQMENFIASNVCKDNSADVFDMVILRQMLIKELEK